jgi:hypothetical protein
MKIKRTVCPVLSYRFDRGHPVAFISTNSKLNFIRQTQLIYNLHKILKLGYQFRFYKTIFQAYRNKNIACL